MQYSKFITEAACHSPHQFWFPIYSGHLHTPLTQLPTKPLDTICAWLRASGSPGKKINHQKTYLAGRSDSSGGKAYGGSAEAEDLLY